MTDNHVARLIRSIAGDRAGSDLLDTLQIDRALMIESAGAVSRGAFVMALCALLFDGCVGRSPTAALYVSDCRRRRERIAIDHAALYAMRMVARPTGSSSAGAPMFARILESLGYQQGAAQPADAPHVTGRAFLHREYPMALPQLWIGEVHAERFSRKFQSAAERVFTLSRDPLSLRTLGALAEFAERGSCELRVAAPALKEIVAAFGRWHEIPTLADYKSLEDESAEAGWLAAHGWALEHVAERVNDVAMTACSQRSLARPVNSAIVTSATGTVRRTAFKPDPARCSFRADDDSRVELTVPGAFFEFISRDLVTGPDGRKRMDMSLGTGTAGSVKRTANG